MDVLQLSADELRELAKTITQRPDGAARHWARLAAILGRVEDESLWSEYGYGSLRAYAEEELDLSTADVHALVKLWQMVRRAYPAVAWEAWSVLPRSRAVELRRVLSLGGDPVAWLDRAKTASSTEVLRHLIDQHLSIESWTTFHCAVPVELDALIEAALILALPEALQIEVPPGVPLPTLDPERAKQKDTRFRCLEVLVRSYLTSREQAPALAA